MRFIDRACCAISFGRSTATPVSHLFHHYLAHCDQQKIPKTVIKRRLDKLVKEVSATDRHISFVPGKSWWLYKREKPNEHGAVTIEQQLGFSADEMKASELGRFWRKKILELSGGRMRLWPGGDGGNDYITVVGETASVQPTLSCIVTDASSSHVRLLARKIAMEAPFNIPVGAIGNGA